jgi:hypothetical protein
MIKKISLKPSFLVYDGLRLKSGVRYRQTDRITKTVGKGELVTYKGERTIADVKEFKQAKALRERLWRLLLRDPDTQEDICTHTIVGLICPWEKEGKFDITVSKIYDEIDKNNFETCKMYFSPVKFVITPDNTPATATIARSIIEILDGLKTALENADYKGIRSYLRNTRGLSTIWPDDIGVNLDKALNSCRKQANDIAKELRKAPNNFEKVKKGLDISKIDLARAQFLEIEGVNEDSKKIPKINHRYLEI